ncbi:hypothetical protein HNP52_000317 [Sphingomonas kyeonggiensis]|uniref:Uncharacterized protein n=1 Tax=Sphingomonas kyeonggiensis TaxID=1268553 RepID=A0A7W7JXP0_9SPHN|nr:hypothetical protein [Sphingomonas kyeonggiensis]MBB4837266.1 hypothetical protein [Sphingomonas kyeonggiensis]
MGSAILLGAVETAVRSTLDLFIEDAPELHGREHSIDPVPEMSGGILLTIDGDLFAVRVERVRR